MIVRPAFSRSAVLRVHREVRHRSELITTGIASSSGPKHETKTRGPTYGTKPLTSPSPNRKISQPLQRLQDTRASPASPTIFRGPLSHRSQSTESLHVTHLAGVALGVGGQLQLAPGVEPTLMQWTPHRVTDIKITQIDHASIDHRRVGNVDVDAHGYSKLGLT